MGVVGRGCSAAHTQLPAYAGFYMVPNLRPKRDLVGDWSATYFNCLCCPAVLRALFPDARLVGCPTRVPRGRNL